MNEEGARIREINDSSRRELRENNISKLQYMKKICFFIEWTKGIHI